MSARLRLLLLGALAPAMPGLAAEVELGTQWMSDDGAQFGRYSGLEDEGFEMVGNADAGGSWMEGANWNLWLSDIGLPTYDALFGAEVQGRAGLTLSADGSREYRRADGVSPYTADGRTLSLPAGWVAGQNTTDFTSLDASALRFDQERERDRYGIDAFYQFGPRWRLELGWQRETQDGTRALGGNLYIDASRGNVAMLPVPEHQEVDDYSARLRFDGDRLSSSVSWLYTRFDNRVESIDWQSPYTGVAFPAADFPNGIGTLSLAPDHERHQFRLDGAAAPIAGLSLSWDAAWARTEQDDALLPYTGNTGLVVTVPPPRDSLNAQLDTTSVDLRGAWRPQTSNRWLRRLTLRSGWHLDDRDYDIPREAWQYVRGDGADQPAADLAIFNTAHDRQREAFELLADYGLPWWRTRLTGGYEYEKIERSNAAVEETESDTYLLTARMMPLAHLSVRVETRYSDRRASTYNWDQSFFARRTTDFINATPDDQRFDNHPLLRQYHLANAETTSARATLGWSGIPRLYAELDLEWRDLDYDETDMGLLGTELTRAGIDVQYSADDKLSLFAWMDASRYVSDASGRSFGGGSQKPANRTAPPLPQGSDPARNWVRGTEDEVFSLGIGSRYEPSDRFELELSYAYVGTSSSNDFGSGGAAGLDATPLPDLETDMHHLQSALTWHWREQVDLRFTWQYFVFDEDDWGRDQVGPTTLPTVLGTGEAAFDDDLHAIGAAVIYSF